MDLRTLHINVYLSTCGELHAYKNKDGTEIEELWGNVHVLKTREKLSEKEKIRGETLESYRILYKIGNLYS